MGGVQECVLLLALHVNPVNPTGRGFSWKQMQCWGLMEVCASGSVLVCLSAGAGRGGRGGWRWARSRLLNVCNIWTTASVCAHFFFFTVQNKKKKKYSLDLYFAAMVVTFVSSYNIDRTFAGTVKGWWSRREAACTHNTISPPDKSG